MQSNLEVYNRYVPELNVGIPETENFKKIDFSRQVLNFVVSKPVGEVIFKAIVLGKFSWQTRKVENLTEKQELTKKGLQKELAASAIRVGLVAAAIIISVGVAIGGILIGAVGGSAFLGFTVSTVGLLVPTVLLWRTDEKSAVGVIDVASLAFAVGAFMALNARAVAYTGLRLLLNTDLSDSKQTWVDQEAAKLVGFKVPTLNDSLDREVVIQVSSDEERADSQAFL